MKTPEESQSSFEQAKQELIKAIEKAEEIRHVSAVGEKLAAIQAAKDFLYRPNTENFLAVKYAMEGVHTAQSLIEVQFCVNAYRAALTKCVIVMQSQEPAKEELKNLSLGFVLSHMQD